MINQQLIEETANSIIHSLRTKQKVCDSLYTLENVLPKSVCEKLWNYIQTTDQWQPIEDKFYQKNRRKITWHSDSIIEELHCAFEQATNSVNQVFLENINQNFIGIALWEDSEEYNINWHTDNPLLSSALQIYLFDTCPDECGTTFKIYNNNIDLPFIHNTAYLANHNIFNKLLHKTTKSIPMGVKRYSLYVSWSLTEKLPG